MSQNPLHHLLQLKYPDASALDPLTYNQAWGIPDLTWVMDDGLCTYWWRTPISPNGTPMFEVSYGNRQRVLWSANVFDEDWARIYSGAVLALAWKHGVTEQFALLLRELGFQNYEGFTNTGVWKTSVTESLSWIWDDPYGKDYPR